MSGWLKAGLIGAAILVVVNLVGIIPLLGCITFPLTLVVYVVIGVLAASYLPPMRTAGKGAGEGALAALIASIIGGITGMVIGIVQASIGGAQALAQIPPEAMDALSDIGMPPGFLFGPVGATVFGSCCCTLGVLIAVGLAAIGGAIYASVKPE